MSEQGAAEGQGASADRYRSPALSRLERGSRHHSPAGSLVRMSPEESETPLLDRLAALEARVETVEQHQLEIAANLGAANAAFRRLTERLKALQQGLAALGEDPPAPARSRHAGDGS